MKNRSNEIRTNEIRIRREPSVHGRAYYLTLDLSLLFTLLYLIEDNLQRFKKREKIIDVWILYQGKPLSPVSQIALSENLA